jgi:hypothetical protein
MRILAPPPSGVTLDSIQARLPAVGANTLFVTSIAPALWAAAVKYAVDPVGMIAQSLKETAGGAFTGKVRPEFYNTAGIKVRHPDVVPGVTDGDNPLAHAMFANWAVGAEAHAQHLRAYTGALVDGHLVVDPRLVFVVGRYRVEDFEELGGKWAPSPSYGQEVVAVAARLLAA